MLNNRITSNTIDYENDQHLFDENSSNLSSENSFLPNMDNIFHQSTTNSNVNNDIVDNIVQYLNTNEHNSTEFHFILNVPPALSSRINEETTTYLNQGQPYEIKFHINKFKNENLSNTFIDYSLPTTTTYRSIIRLCFWDKTLQIQEYELIQKWLNEYKLSSLFDIDMNLTYGILSIIYSKQISNAVELVWDASTTPSAFIRFKCTSTDFAHKRHGGEKGIPLRIQIDTYHENNLDKIQHVHSCYCKIQLFRLKGAQRKSKADKIKFEKLNIDQRRQYQTTYEYTIMQTCLISSLYTLNLLSHTQSPDDLFDICTTSTTEENGFIKKKDLNEIKTKIEDYNQNNNNIKDLSLLNINSNSSQISSIIPIKKITIQSSHEDVFNWLNQNNFSSIINHFQYYNGIDILRLTINDIRQICNDDHAISIRLYNQLNETIIRPLKIFYIKMTNTDIYSAIYLHRLTRNELYEQICELIQQPPQEIYDIMLELNKIKIKIDHDNVVKYSLPNEGQFYLKIFPYEFTLCLLNS